MLTCTACEREAPQGTEVRAGCVFGGCEGIYIQTGMILALAFQHKDKTTVDGQEYQAWDVLCRACMSHELWGKTVYYDCPNVQVIGIEDGDIDRWGNDRVISCSYCGSVLLDDAQTKPTKWDDPEAAPRGKYDCKEDEMDGMR